ncbi:PAS domain-containing protein [Geoalkalibacter halelectricus]|uniref:PAS domain-containing protein n=1 Tax=Geoalkalibacter halelectricus TaxID=2847045 RepID=A0ABY5ZFT6_9BACT|nr:PAS domain-containing protein [Geoalkalibacter halelectricus]MDO3378189.1 PAS domain-containing protein [Geoalkalibacter halelectricus]UWZ78032.1 PAS domain-containing protein [Geoalkalibacter halelectricus]
MTPKFWIGAVAAVLLALVTLGVWQAEQVRVQTAGAYLERQLWLARQGALFLERQGADDRAALAAAAQRITIAEGRLAESQMSLYDRQAQSFLPEIAPPESLRREIADDSRLRRKLALGIHGGLAVALEDGRWLVTYLPLAAGDAALTLVLATPEAEIIASWPALVRAQALGHLGFALLAAALGAWLWRRRASEARAGDDQDPCLAEELSDLREQCCALAQENALLGAARREYQLLVEGAEHGVARLNSTGHILFCSKPFLALIGRERKEVVGRSLLDLDLLADEVRTDLQHSLGLLREGSAPGPTFCTLVVRGQGPLEVQINLSPLRVDGETTGYLLQLQPTAFVETHLRASLS